MTDERSSTEVTEQLEKVAQAIGLASDPDKYSFFTEMLREEQFGLAFDTIEDFAGEQESEDMVAMAGSLWRLRSLLQIPRR